MNVCGGATCYREFFSPFFRHSSNNTTPKKSRILTRERTIGHKTLAIMSRDQLKHWTEAIWFGRGMEWFILLVLLERDSDTIFIHHKNAI